MNPSVKIEIPDAIARLARKKTIRTTAHDIEQAVLSLESVHSGLSRKILDDRGKIRPHVLVFLNGTDIKNLDGLKTVLKDGDTLTVAAAFSGG